MFYIWPPVDSYSETVLFSKGKKRERKKVKEKKKKVEDLTFPHLAVLLEIRWYCSVQVQKGIY